MEEFNAQKLGIELHTTDDFLNSAILMAVPAACLYPLDRIELLLRTYPLKKHKKTGYRTLVSAITGISRREGITGYWRGFLFHLTASVATGIALFYMPRIASHIYEIRLWWQLGLPYDLGFLFENTVLLLSASALSYPFKLISTKLSADTLTGQDAHRPYLGIIDCASEIFSDPEQTGGFWKGFWTSVTSDFAQAGFKSLAYGVLRTWYEPYLSGALPISQFNSLLLETVIREVSEVTGNFITYPLQVASSLQKISGEPEYMSLPQENIGVWKTIKYLYKHKLPENFVRMFSGFSASVLKSALTVVVSALILQRIQPKTYDRF